MTQARAEFADLVNRVVYGGERVVVTRHGKPIVALVPAADLDRLAAADDDAARADDATTAAGEQPATVVRLRGQHDPRTVAPTGPPAHRLDVAARHDPPPGR